MWVANALIFRVKIIFFHRVTISKATPTKPSAPSPSNSDRNYRKIFIWRQVNENYF